MWNVVGKNILGRNGSGITLSPRFQDDQSPCCSEGSGESNTVQQEPWVLTIERWVEKRSQKSQEMIDWIDPRVHRPQWLIHTGKLARFNGLSTQCIQTIDIREIEDCVEHGRA
jgi:hypothetical protein